MPGSLQGEVALVTGGATGIGRAVVRRFVAEGARVVVLQRRRAAAEDLLAELGDAIAVVEGDVRSATANRAAVAEAIERFGGLDVLVGNAGVWDFGRPLARYGDDAELEDAFREMFDVNVKGYLLAAAAARAAILERRGTMIFTTSSSASYAGGGGPVYVASKHAVVGLIRQLAYELAPTARVNGVAPGATRTPLHGPAALGQTDRHVDALLEGEDAHDRVAAGLPLGFVSEPEDHAGIFVLLASRDGARFTTGAVVPSDGGLEVRRAGPAAAAAARASA